MKKEAMLYKKLQGEAVECYLCNHRCRLLESKYGFCGVRQNIGGTLYTHVYANIVANHVDPIEKKPLYHFLPGTSTYSIATIGCNFRCGFCQNWQISQLSTKDAGTGEYELKPEEVVKEAQKSGCKSIAYTYTEPTIFFEYALDTARLAKEKGLYNIFVTNGYMTKEALDCINPFLDAANIDLKFFNDQTYKKICQGRLEPVLESIRHMKKLGIWIEVTTLIVPGLNDSEEELKGMAGFIADTGVEIPWHI
ncbi:MAG: AmmeMemoRadiSam system radical SAM enzyme, partial [Candidatus Omnitrophica bacterium]|nr:AmmeMemoRadiSam system radical SAM enzyme [Candidatus Omnitrophota bacterium]